MADLHQFYVELDEDGTYYGVDCPYHKQDTTRPCWARLEDGTLDPDGVKHCNYQGWLDNVGSEMVTGYRRVDLDGAWWDWSNGDYPVLHLAAVPEQEQ